MGVTSSSVSPTKNACQDYVNAAAGPFFYLYDRHAATTPPRHPTAIPPTTLTFSPGQTTKTITVPVNGDIVDENDETFTVNLSNPTNATLSTASGTTRETISVPDREAECRRSAFPVSSLLYERSAPSLPKVKEKNPVTWANKAPVGLKSRTCTVLAADTRAWAMIRLPRSMSGETTTA